MGHLIVDENDTNGHSKYDRGIEAYAGGDIYDVNPSGDWSCGGNQNPNEDGCFNIDKIYPQVNYIVTFLSLPNVTFDVEYCHPLFGCTGFGKGEGIMFKGPYTLEFEEYQLWEQNNYVGIYNAPSDFKLEFKLSSLAIDIYSQQEWLDNYYYPVLPRYDSSGKFIEGDFPNDNIPFPTEGIITNDEQDGESLSISLTSETIDTNVFNDESGQQNKGFTVNDFKPKFENDTLEIKKTKKMNPIKKSNKNRAF